MPLSRTSIRRPQARRRRPTTIPPASVYRTAFGTDRNIVGHMAIAVERARLVDGLRERTEFLENILQNTLDGIVVVDAQNRIKTWNEGARNIFGYGAPEAIGSRWISCWAQRSAGRPAAAL